MVGLVSMKHTSIPTTREEALEHYMHIIIIKHYKHIIIIKQVPGDGLIRA